MNEFTVSWINKYLDKSMTFEESKLIFDNEYETSNDEKIIREGLFSLLWNQFKERPMHAYEAVSFYGAGLIKSTSEQLFFKVEKIKDNNLNVENVLLFFYADPEVMPLFIIEDSLNFLKKSLALKKENKIYCHLTMNLNEGLSKQAYLSYQFNFMKLVTSYLGSDLHYIETNELFKLSDMSNWVIFEPGVKWVSGDNYLSHVCLSKNANILLESPDFQFTKITDSYNISQYHRMNIGQSDVVSDSKLWSRLKLFNEANQNTKRNILNIPSTFLELAYTTR